ncbi:MAG: hypothetical protein RL490_1560 [Pseudomonadota bacterium]|jgi:hypothetical protein
MRPRSLFLLLPLAAAGCAPSPLYVSHGQPGTVGEIPRDGRGEPIWTAIRPTPAGSPAPALPVPVTPPQR